MARPSKAVVAKTTGTSIANIDAQLQAQADLLKDQLGQASGNKLKLEATGNFVTPEGLDVGNEIQVVVLDMYNRNFFYSTPFNSNNPTPPDCYALGKGVKGLAPENDSPSPQNDACATCSLNAFGTGINGIGKACQNRYHIAVLLIDPENPDAHNAPDAPIYLLDVSPSNLQPWDGALKNVMRTLGAPVKAVFTVTARSVGTYAKMSVSIEGANPDYAAHAARIPETVDLLTRKPDFAGYAAKAATPQRRAAPAARRGAAAARR